MPPFWILNLKILLTDFVRFCHASCSKAELCLPMAICLLGVTVSPGAKLLILVFFLLTVRSVPGALLAF